MNLVAFLSSAGSLEKTAPKTEDIAIALSLFGVALLLYLASLWLSDRHYNKTLLETHIKWKIKYMEDVLNLKLVENDKGGYDATYLDFDTNTDVTVSLPKDYRNPLAEIGAREQKKWHTFFCSYYKDFPPIVDWFKLKI